MRESNPGRRIYVAGTAANHNTLAFAHHLPRFTLEVRLNTTSTIHDPYLENYIILRQMFNNSGITVLIKTNETAYRLTKIYREICVKR